MDRVIKKRTYSGTMGDKVQPWEQAHRELARKAAEEGIVLLKNENHFLPLKHGSKVALYGAGAAHTIKGGTGSGDVNERECISIWQGMKNAGFDIANENWLRSYQQIYQNAREEWKNDILKRTAENKNPKENFFSIYTNTPFEMPCGEMIDKAEEDVKTAFFIISRIAGEGADRYEKKGDYYLTDEEHALFGAVCRNYENVVVAINTGGQIDLSFTDAFVNIRSLLYVSQPGMEGGNAFANVISGKIAPSGKLADTWAYQYGDYPSASTFSHNNGNVEKEIYTEGIYVGYRYFDSFDQPVRYGFGYGMTYTDFSIAFQGIEKTDKNTIRILAEVTNCGQCDGKETVQIYASAPSKNAPKAARSLIGYEKTDLLKPKEKTLLTISIPIKRFFYYNEEQSGWMMDKGLYGIWIGSSLKDSRLVAGITLDGDVLFCRLKHICKLQKNIKELTQPAELRSEKEQQYVQVIKENHMLVVSLYAADYETKEQKYRRNQEIYQEQAIEFVDQLSIDQCIRLAAGDPAKAQGGNLGAAGSTVPGSAGETSDCATEQGLASIVLADGPAGLRLMKYYHINEGKLVPMPFEFSLEGGIFYNETEKLPGQRYYQYTTAIPVGTMLAQTWNQKLLYEIGNMIGKEMEFFGVTLWLAPGMNIHRNPLCGRNFEYFSEDPYLTGTMAAAITNGVQSNQGCGTTIKHFACNNQEDHRMGSDSVVSERALREIYLKGFEIAVREARPLSVMTSYNLINGVHAANHVDLCTNVLRNEWNFDGMIMTDWTTTEVDDSCTASGCMRAGNDLVMPGNFSDSDNMYQELEAGSLEEADLRACVSRIVGVIWKSNQYKK